MIVSLSGGIGSGKDTAGAWLVARGFKRLSFATPLKDIAALLFSWDREMLEGATPQAREEREMVDQWWSEALNDIVTPRSMLQYLGTDLFRDHLHDDIWVLTLKKVLAQHPDTNFVITDARFFNEAHMIQSMGGQAYGIYRKLPRWLDEFYEFVDANSSRVLGCGFMDADLSNNHAAGIIRATAKQFFESKKLAVHQSEWELLLYNSYDGLIDNTSTIEDLHKQLEKFV